MIYEPKEWFIYCTLIIFGQVTECTSADEEQEYEDSLLQGIKTEPGEETETSTIQIRVNASAPRKKEETQSSVSLRYVIHLTDL